MENRFNNEEVRVLGVLMEKQLTTPEYYPMTPNAIRTASNQKSNRNPVVNYELEQVLDILQQLRKKQMLVMVTSSGSRVRKYEHRMKEVFFFSQREQALMGMLMLRGPQTIGELRQRTERLADFETLTGVEQTLNELMAETRRPQILVMKLPVWPGQKEPRYVQLLAGEPDVVQLAEEASMAPNKGAASTSRLTLLEEKVEALSGELDGLKAQFETFKQQFE